MFDKEQKGSSQRALQFYGITTWTVEEMFLKRWVTFFDAHLTFLSWRSYTPKIKYCKAARFCTWFLQEGNVDIAPCSWKDLLHKPKRGVFWRKCWRPPPLTFAGKKTDKTVYSSSIIRTSTLSQTAAQVPAVTPKGLSSNGERVPSACYSQQPKINSFKMPTGEEEVFRLLKCS